MGAQTVPLGFVRSLRSQVPFEGGCAYPCSGYFDVLWHNFDADALSPKACSSLHGRTRTEERIKDDISHLCKQFDEKRWEGEREGCRMLLIATFRSQMQHITGQYHLTSDPMLHGFAEGIPGVGLLSLLIRLAQVLEPLWCPVTNGHQHGILAHLKRFLFGEV